MNKNTSFIFIFIGILLATLLPNSLEGEMKYITEFVGVILILIGVWYIQKTRTKGVK
jgi:drug/metabolite transporter (DMT)-like permease